MFIDPHGLVCRGFFLTCDVRHEPRAISEVMNILTKSAQALYGPYNAEKQEPEQPVEKEVNEKQIETTKTSEVEEVSQNEAAMAPTEQKEAKKRSEAKVYKKKQFTVYNGGVRGVIPIRVNDTNVNIDDLLDYAFNHSSEFQPMFSSSFSFFSFLPSCFFLIFS